MRTLTSLSEAETLNSQMQRLASHMSISAFDRSTIDTSRPDSDKLMDRALVTQIQRRISGSHKFFIEHAPATATKLDCSLVSVVFNNLTD